MIFKFGELFCGPGGIGLAAKLVEISNSNETFKIEHAWSSDYDKDSCNTYRNNICPDNPKSVICKDIRKLNLKTLNL